MPQALLLSAVLTFSSASIEAPSASTAPRAEAESHVRATALGAIIGTLVGVGGVAGAFAAAPHTKYWPVMIPGFALLIPLLGTLGAAVALYIVDVWAPGILVATAATGAVALVAGAGLGFVAYGLPPLRDRWRKACCGGDSDGGNGVIVFVPLGAAVVAAVAVPTAALLSASMAFEE